MSDYDQKNRTLPDRIVNWVQIHPSGPGGWRPDLMSPSRHRLLAVADHRIKKTSWHNLRGSKLPFQNWLAYNQVCGTAFKMRTEGVLTHFPQLALLAAFRKRYLYDRFLVCHNFNLGSIYRGLRQKVCCRVFRSVDRFLVHSTAEVRVYSEWLQIAPEKFEFVHLQQEPIRPEPVELPKAPYFFAAGSANRDYQTLIEAARIVPAKVVIVAGPSIADRLIGVPPNVEIRTRLTPGQCWSLLSSSICQIIPLVDTPVASGQVALVTGLVAGIPVIATRSVGTVDYISDNENGLLVSPSNSKELAKVMSSILDDTVHRQMLADGGLVFAKNNLTDEVHFRHLVRILDRVTSAHK